MSNMEEMKKHIKSKQEKRSEKELAKLQWKLHCYFDLGGVDLTKKDIEKINAYLQENIVLDDEQEAMRYLYLMENFATLNGGRKAYEVDRAQVLNKLRNGEVVSKSDACIAANKVIVMLKEIVSYNFDEAGNKIAHLIRPGSAYQINVNPESESLYERVPFTARMDKVVRAFQDVKASAFRSASYSIR